MQRRFRTAFNLIRIDEAPRKRVCAVCVIHNFWWKLNDSLAYVRAVALLCVWEYEPPAFWRVYVMYFVIIFVCAVPRKHSHTPNVCVLIFDV